jgi:hypothetical protein
MVFTPVLGTVAVELRYTVAAQNIENTLNFYIPSGVSPEAVQWVAEFVGVWWYTYLREFQRNQLELREIYARDLGSESGSVYSDTTYAGENGSASVGTLLPNNVSYAITFRTAGRGRSYRGRNYLCALSTSWVTQSTIASGFRDPVVECYERLLPGGGSVPSWAVWCVVSRWHNNVRRTPYGLAIPITAVATSDDHVDSARKRLPGRGF